MLIILLLLVFCGKHNSLKPSWSLKKLFTIQKSDLSMVTFADPGRVKSNSGSPFVQKIDIGPDGIRNSKYTLNSHVTIKTPQGAKFSGKSGKFKNQFFNLRLLNVTEEITAGRISSTGRKLEIIKSDLTKVLGREPTYHEWAAKCGLEISELESYIDTVARARTLLVIHNMRFVESIVQDVIEHSYAGKKVSYFEVFTEAMLGLIKASELYNGDHKFGTFAYIYVKSAALKAFTRLQPFLSHQEALLYNRAKKTEYKLKMSLNRAPTDEEVAAEMKVTKPYLQYLRGKASKRVISGDVELVSDKARGNEVSQNYFDMDLISPDSPDFDEQIQWNAQFMAALDCLDPSDRRILALRYGLFDGQPRTVNVTAQLMCMTEEGVRLAIIRANNKLKSSSQCREILQIGQPEIEQNTLGHLFSAKRF